MSKQFYSFVKNEAKESELLIDGVIASESWWDDEISPKMFRDELAKHSGDLTVRINSPGGDVFAGVSIYNALTEYDGNVTIKVDGIAASIASLIAMAGDKIVMLPGAMMMVHLPWSLAAGNAKELEEAVEMLKKTGESMVPIYVARTGQTTERINELLEAETWMTASDAVELGFADEAVEAKSNLSEAINAALNYASTVSNAVMQPAMSLKARKVANVTDESENPAQVAPEEPKAPSEAEEPKETTEVTKPVESEPTNPVKEETKMTEQEKAAAAQVITPSAQANPAATPKPSVKDYLKTKDSMEAFARILEENAGRSSEDVRAAWKSHLEVKAGVTNPEIFLPETLITEITDAFTRGGEIWNRVTKTGADVWRAAWDSNTDVDADSGRGRGYNRSVEEEKAEQELTFAERILRPQMIYKYITLNREDVKNQRSTGALVRFVLAELPRRIIREVERAIVIGDGRAPGSAYKIQEGTPEGFFPIKSDATANNAFASTYTPAAGETRYASMLKARDLINAEGSVVLIAKKGYLTDVLLEENATGGFLFAPGTSLPAVLRFEAILEPDWMDSDTDNDAYLVVLPNYRVVGDTSIEAFTNFLLSTNKQEYLQEIWAGGGLTVRKTAVAVVAATS
jgi:ATP-dependent Clp protease protease subunit